MSGDPGVIIERQPWDLLIPHLLKVGANPDLVIPRLKTYCTLAISWNRGHSNLFSKNDEGRMLERHVLESIEPARFLQESEAARWLDLGSGGGFPAIPLAIVGVGAHWTLVESRRTKTLFLRKVIQEMGLKNIEVVNDRMEAVVDDVMRKDAYDGFASRATMTLAPTLQLARQVVRAGGAAFLWKGSRREEEMKLDKRWKESWDFNGLLGVGDGKTVVARFIRTS